jgi:hypothetical protein
MFAGRVLPSWFEIEDRLITEVESRGFGNFRSSLNETVMSVGLVLRRVENIRTAFYRADHEAAELLRKRFADIDIANVLNDLLGAVSQMAMIVAGSVLTGGAIGAGVGALAGGAGAVPGAFTGIAIGLQAGTWILGVLGLASIAEFFVDGLAPLIEHYLRGIETAWEGTRGDEGLSPFSQDDFLVVERASHHFARGHVEVVVLLLSAIVDYLTRGRGHAGQLAKEMRASGKGQRLGQWMLKHQDALKKRPDLQPRAPGKGPLTPQEPPPGPQRQHEQNDQQHRKNPLGMPEYKVPCFNASNMHYSKVPEFDRQLGGQERGLNDLTVDDQTEDYYECFLEDMGAPYCRREVPGSSIEKYKSIFPPLLLSHWEKYGWTGYGDGIFWTVDPGELSPIIQAWAMDSGIEHATSFHVIARNAFGDLYLWQEGTGNHLNINTKYARYTLSTINRIPADKLDISVQSFFISKSRESNDFDDMFNSAFKTLGPLQHDEMYGFVPALALGGPSDLEHLQKVKTIEHLTFLSQLTPLTDWGFPDVSTL